MGAVGRAGRRLRPQDEEAVQAFQVAYGLPVTGSIDNDTWNALFTTTAEDPTAHDPSEGPTGDTLVDVGTDYGVVVGTIGSRFTRAGRIPGITYS